MKRGSSLGMGYDISCQGHDEEANQTTSEVGRWLAILLIADEMSQLEALLLKRRQRETFLSVSSQIHTLAIQTQERTFLRSLCN